MTRSGANNEFDARSQRSVIPAAGTAEVWVDNPTNTNKRPFTVDAVTDGA